MGEQVQGAEDRSGTNKRKLQGLRNEYMQNGANNGLCVEDLAQTFSLSEEWVQNGILGGSGRKREKGEEPLTALEINNLKLDFACLMGQQGYTIEQCNYMMNLTSDGDLDRQQRQAEQEQKHRELETKNTELERKHRGLESKHEKLRDKANKVLGNLQKELANKDKQIEDLSKGNTDLQEQVSDKDKQIEVLSKENAELTEQHRKEIERLEQQITTDKQQQQEDIRGLKAASKSIIEKAQNGCAECKNNNDAEIKRLQDSVYLAESRVKLLEAALAKKEEKASTGRKKLTGVQEEEVLAFYKKRKYKVTELSLKKLEKECEIILTKKAVYNLFDRFGIQR